MKIQFNILLLIVFQNGANAGQSGTFLKRDFFKIGLFQTGDADINMLERNFTFSEIISSMVMKTS